MAVDALHDAVEEASAADTADYCIGKAVVREAVVNGVMLLYHGQLANRLDEDGRVACPDVGMIERRDVDGLLSTLSRFGEELFVQVLVGFIPRCADLNHFRRTRFLQLGDHVVGRRHWNYDRCGAAERDGGVHTCQTCIAT